MRIKLSALSKKQLVITGVVISMVAGGVTAALNQPQSTGADTSPIVQQVNHNTDELANHESRITNTENDVKDLQSKTDTPSSTSNTIVKEVTTPTPSQPVADPTPSPAAPAKPAPIVVTQSDFVLDVSGNNYCSLHYSDGTNMQVPAPATGHGADYKDNCQTLVGQPKS